MSIDSVKKGVLKKIKPSAKEEKAINEFVTKLLRISEVVSKAQPVITGSLGRGTWLKGDHDIDLFLMFDKGVSREGLEKIGMENAKEIVSELKGKYIIKYAEHPYVRANFNGMSVDIVPCYKIKNGDKIISAVDRSPLHVDYVLRKMKPAQRDEVRLLKQFCKGIGVYGSDAKTLGVSGYICELLIIKYGKFESAIRSLSCMKAGSIIDIENHWKSSDEKHLKEVFRSNPLILIDPIDKERNVASSLSCENFARLSSMAGKMIKKPSERFFYRIFRQLEPGQIKKLHERKTKFFAVSFTKPDVIDDILHPQLRKTQSRLITLLNHNEFRAIRSYVFVDDKTSRAFLIFEMECWELPFINNMIGPPVFSIKNSRDFLEKYKNPLFGPYVEGQNWVIEKQRTYRNAGESMRKFLGEKPEKLMLNGIPEEIAKKISRPWIIDHEDFWKMAVNNKEFSGFLREKYFESL